MKLYKYTRCSSYLLESLENTAIWLAPPYSLNDCHEGAFRYVPTSFNSARKLVQDNPFLTKNLDKQFNDLFQVTRTDNEFNDLVVGRYEMYRSLFGVVSLTEVPNSPLMWAHYAAQHTGICLEFEVNRDAEDIYPVMYTNTIPGFTANDLLFDSKRTITKIMTTKSLDWSYEKEWRLLVENGVLWDGGKLTDMPFNITGVIYGHRASQEEIDKIERILCDGKVTKKVAIPSIEKYMMDIEDYEKA